MGGTINLGAGGAEPVFGADAGGNTSATPIQAPPYSTVTIQAQAALYVFNGVAAAGSVPTERFEFAASLAQSGVTFKVGGPKPGGQVATINAALQSGTGTIYASIEPPDNRGS